jgi:uncharacterized protein YdeI (YjbR/CyaY-like superfamily)
MRQIRVTTRSQWRQWLAKNHDRLKDRVWLVFHRKKTGKSSVEYDESVEEALCFGWIDSLIKSIDVTTYCRRFTPRKDDSLWSITNQRRAAKIIQEGRITQFGMAKVEAAKKRGQWGADPRPRNKMNRPQDQSEALAMDRKTKDFFDSLAPIYQKHFIGWLNSAKRLETRAKRLKKSLALLKNGHKLGPKK